MENSVISENQIKLLTETIEKNAWGSTHLGLRVVAWSSLLQSSDVLRNYLCKDGSGYIHGYYDGAGTFYIKQFQLRDETWAASLLSQD